MVSKKRSDLSVIIAYMYIQNSLIQLAQGVRVSLYHLSIYSNDFYLGWSTSS